MKRVALRLILPLALLAGVLFTAVPSDAVPGCKKNRQAVCPQIFAPVVCTTQNNKTQIYVNQCIADANCASPCFAL